MNEGNCINCIVICIMVDAVRFLTTSYRRLRVNRIQEFSEFKNLKIKLVLIVNHGNPKILKILIQTI